MDHSQDWPWLMMEINLTTSSQRKDLKHYVILLWCCWRHLLEVRRCARTWRWGNILCSSLAGPLHFNWMELWLKVASTRPGSILELQKRSLCWPGHLGQRFQTCDWWVGMPPVLQEQQGPKLQSPEPFQEAVHGILNPPFKLWCTLSGERISMQRGICAKCSVCPMCLACSNIKQCVYISDIKTQAEMVEGVSCNISTINTKEYGGKCALFCNVSSVNTKDYGGNVLVMSFVSNQCVDVSTAEYEGYGGKCFILSNCENSQLISGIQWII